jgi:hypothetical protein
VRGLSLLTLSLTLACVPVTHQTENALSFAEGATALLQVCYASGGDMSGGVQPPPFYRLPVALVAPTMQILGATAAASVKRRVQAQAQAVRVASVCCSSLRSVCVSVCVGC